MTNCDLIWENRCPQLNIMETGSRIIVKIPFYSQAKDKAPNQENFPKTFDEDYFPAVKVAIEKSAEYYEL